MHTYARKKKKTPTDDDHHIHHTRITPNKMQNELQTGSKASSRKPYPITTEEEEYFAQARSKTTTGPC